VNARHARLRSTLGTLIATAALLGLPAASQSAPAESPTSERRPTSHVDPAELDRGADPRVAYLVRDTIHDGHRRIRVRTPGKNLALYETRTGYLVLSYVFNRHQTLIAVDHNGDQRRLGQAEIIYPVVSPRGRWVTIVRDPLAGSPRAVVRVVNPRTGHLLARRTFRGQAVGVYAVTARSVMLSNLGDPEAPEASTSWWNYRRDTVRRLISGWRPAEVDLRANRILLDRDWRGTSDCQRAAPLTHPRRTLWRECRLMTHDWNAKGNRTLASWPFWEFRHTGTDRWVAFKGRGPDRTGRVTGRLSWNAVWEGNRHFLTLAQSDDGEAAVIRCGVDGRCERASRLWQVPADNDDYFVAPPVVLAENR
jgi:hypothetical protein